MMLPTENASSRHHQRGSTSRVPLSGSTSCSMMRPAERTKTICRRCDISTGSTMLNVSAIIGSLHIVCSGRLIDEFGGPMPGSMRCMAENHPRKDRNHAQNSDQHSDNHADHSG